jgi:hypothetical protein
MLHTQRAHERTHAHLQHAARLMLHAHSTPGTLPPPAVMHPLKPDERRYAKRYAVQLRAGYRDNVRLDSDLTEVTHTQKLNAP